MPTVLFLRHGQASFGGEDYDVLSPVGERQATFMAGELAGAAPLRRIVSGSLARQRETVVPLAAATGRELEIDDRWDEYDSDSILAHHSSSLVRQDRRAHSDAPAVTSAEFQRVLEAALLTWIAAGENDPCAESWPAFAGRVNAALTDLGAALGPGETALVCTSGGVLAALCVTLLRVPATTFVAFNRVTVNAGLTRVALGRAGATLLSFNEQGHLLAPAAGLLTYR